MTKMFGNLTTEGLEEAQDRLGGASLFETNAYKGKLVMAYVGQSGAQGSKASSVTLLIDIDGKEFRETIWITNRDGENSYQDKQDKNKKHPLPGFTTIDDLCLVTTGYGLAEQDVEEKVVKIYNFDEKKDVPTNVPVLVNLLGKDVLFAIQRQTVDKQRKNDAGVYVNTGDTRDENTIEKVFHVETRRTVTEIKQQIEEPIFIDAWVEKNKGKTRNKASGAQGSSGAPGGNAGAPGASGNQPKPKNSLFGN